MYPQFIPQGPTPQADTVRIDRTQVLDPVEFWPKPLDCPDWPFLTGTMQYDGPRGRRGAEARLEVIGQHLNRGARQLKVPTQAEREYAVAATFKRQNGPWYALGITGLAPLGMMAEREAELMVQACHLRGYLRKLDALAEQEVKAEHQRREHEARHTLAEFRRIVPAEVEELNSLKEAAARHQQRLDDERAASQAHALRQHIDTLHAAAVNAAHKLGLSAPASPLIED